MTVPRPLTVLVAAGGLAILAGAQGALSNGSANAVTGPAQIQVSSQQIDYVKVDLGRRGTTPGDSEIMTLRLFNRRITQRPIGRAEIVCTFTNGISRMCRGTYILPKGKLVVGGNMRYRALYEFAVLGGTGLSDNARGTVTSTQTAQRPRREYVLFRLVG